MLQNENVTHNELIVYSICEYIKKKFENLFLDFQTKLVPTYQLKYIMHSCTLNKIHKSLGTPGFVQRLNREQLNQKLETIIILLIVEKYIHTHFLYTCKPMD